jgi:hypothetical protein
MAPKDPKDADWTKTLQTRGIAGCSTMRVILTDDR